jgi:mRNA interferase RelE/StbE
MTYEIEFKPRAIKDLEGLSKDIQRRILAKIESLADDLAGDVKRLTNFTPEYRLRVGDYRILFELEAKKIVIYRAVHRKDAYR